MDIYSDMNEIIHRSIEANMPGEAVRSALREHKFTGNIHLLAVGKAAWTMANAACEQLGKQITNGLVITKYGHARAEIPGIEIMEAGHPLSDANTLAATQMAMDMAARLGADDELLFLLSGGGSALFEKPLPGVTLNDVVDINRQLLASGADITSMNVVRKRLSAVKAGRFAKLCEPANVFAVVLSDVIGDRLDTIASGPVAPDVTTTEDAKEVIEKYGLHLSQNALGHIFRETPKEISNVKAVVTGSVRTLCGAAAQTARELGYTPYILTTSMDCQAREAGVMIAAIARQTGCGEYSAKRPCALLFGGESVVNIRGDGKGGRNQELALAAAEGIEGIENLVVFSFGSDGTDGPTDAAGGYVDGTTMAKLRGKGLSLRTILDNNDSYHGLQTVNGLIITGPTGTNVNDLAVILSR